jgi:hypothetical protein
LLFSSSNACVRITASNFGTVVKRNPSIPIKKLVRNMLYSTFHGNRHTRNDILQEDTTIEEYKLKKAEENENVIVYFPINFDLAEFF